jgi:Ca-activated chloride channel family protein
MKTIHTASTALAALACGFLLMGAPASPGKGRKPVQESSGALLSIDPDGNIKGSCPLRHTDVQAEISGYVARVTVTQDFENLLGERIEAVYTFPLPANAAVDDMTIHAGERVIKGKIKERGEARAIYDAARNAGHMAALLDQERPNIFTQSIANIKPGEKVKVVIRYVENVKFDDGVYEFSFPMVVGPRYIPGQAIGKQGGGWAPDTNQVPDASRITPPVTPQGTRAGHDISLAVKLDAGVPIQFLRSLTHDTDITRPDSEHAVVKLRNAATLPNKDFVLQYDVTGAKMTDGVLAHQDSRGGFFTLVLQPPDKPLSSEITPKEIVFVLDTSGSMMGFPIEKAKEAMKLALDGLHPKDTFNLITFSGDTHVLFPEPVPATPENLRRAQSFLASRAGSGGTEMMKAIRAALDPTDSREHIRIVVFMTDGYVGNDFEIIGEVQKHPNARVFSFGIGNSVNRFLLDKMAEAGRGEVEYVGLNDDGSAAAKRLHERIRTPLLTDIDIDWQGLPVSEVYPKRIPDLFSAKPVVLNGRYSKAVKGAITLRGKMGGKPFSRQVSVDLSGPQKEHEVLATLWARRKVDDLMGQDWVGMQRGNPAADVKQQVTQLGLEYRLMTQFTSFVAVEERVTTEGGAPKRIEVPVEMPEGVSYKGVFGESRDMRQLAAAMPTGAKMSTMGGFVGGPRPMAAPPVRMEREADLRAKAANEAQVRSRVDIAKDAAERKLAPELAALLIQAATDVDVVVWLNDTSEASVKALKDAGLVVKSTVAGKSVTGRVSSANLIKLAQLQGVRYVSKKV